MKLDIRIQSTGKRDWWVDNLYHILGSQKPYHRINTIIGEGKDLWTDAKKVLQSRSPDADYLLVLQDDVLPCKNFIPAVEEILDLTVWNEPITFFSNSPTIETALAKGKSWVKLRVWTMAQAYVMPTKTIPDLIEWVDAKVKPETRFDDERFAMYFFYHEKYVYATAPSLVEHLGWNSTLLRTYKHLEYLKRRDLRTAKVLIPFDEDPLNIDWFAGLSDPEVNNEGNNSQFCDNLL